MAFQYSVGVRNAWLDNIEATIGITPIMRLRTGTQPATTATADSGVVVATMTLPSDWLAAAAAGAKALAGTWQDLSADATGTVAHFRIYESTGVTCHIQGTVTISGGGGDMTLDNNVVAITQQINITAFTLNAGGA